MSRSARLGRDAAGPIVCLITGGDRSRHQIVEQIGAAARGGVDLIQIRERDLDDRAVLELTRESIDVVRGTRARVIVNRRPDLALAAGADGVHLRGASMPASRVRTLTPPEFLIGRSVHSVAEAQAAEQDGGCDYLIFGTVFPSTSKPDGPTAGLEGLRAVCAAVCLPVLAIGGVTTERLPAIAAAGASGVAGISVFAEVHGLAFLVQTMRRLFDTDRDVV